MSNLFFINFQRGNGHIRTTDCKVFASIELLSGFMLGEESLSGYVVKHYYKGNTFDRAEFMGYFGDFSPSAQEVLDMQKIVFADFDPRSKLQFPSAPRTPLNEMPVVVGGTGEYVTRDGRRVVVHEVKDHSDNYSVTRFNCKGTVYTKHPSGRTTRRFATWHESGRAVPLQESKTDIVK